MRKVINAILWAITAIVIFVICVRLVYTLWRSPTLRMWLVEAVQNTCPTDAAKRLPTSEWADDPVILETVKVNVVCLLHYAPAIFGIHIVPKSWNNVRAAVGRVVANVFNEDHSVGVLTA